MELAQDRYNVALNLEFVGVRELVSYLFSKLFNRLSKIDIIIEMEAVFIRYS